MDDSEGFKKRLENIGINFGHSLGFTEKLITDTLLKKKFAVRLKFVLNEGKITQLYKDIGSLFNY